jgi:triphosphoribosyl-dephospho-CoA synthase
MQISSPNDTIAKEWTEGFPRTFYGAELMTHYVVSGLSVKSSIVHLFLRLLSEFPDTLIAKKFGTDVALEVSAKAAHILKEDDADEFDRELIARHVNPGTTADLVIGSLFVLLLGGFRY